MQPPDQPDQAVLPEATGFCPGAKNCHAIQHFMHLHLFRIRLGCGASVPASASRGFPMATPHHIVVIAGSLRKESFTLKIAKALAKLAPDTLKLEVVTLHGISFFNQDLESAPPADWVAFREKLQTIRRRPVRHSRIQPFDPRRAEERHRCRIAALRQEFVPRQAGRHRQQLAGTARRRQRRQTFAEYPAGHLRADHGTAGNLSEWRRRRVRRQGRTRSRTRCRRC